MEARIAFSLEEDGVESADEECREMGNGGLLEGFAARNNILASLCRQAWIKAWPL